MTAYPDDYLACTTCEAKAGGPCYTLLARGPQAMPSRYADAPHSDRRTRGQVRTPAAPRTQKSATPVPQRRAAARKNATAAAWLAVAKKEAT